MDLTVLWVALGSAIGGAGRYAVSGFMARHVGETFPWGTLTVNVLGSLLITLIATVTGPDGRMLVSSTTRQVLMLGVLGGFTTFSSFSIQTLTLAQDGEWARAAGNVAGSVMLCLLGAWVGHALGTAVNR
jgi:CrcB protein